MWCIFSFLRNQIFCLHCWHKWFHRAKNRIEFSLINFLLLPLGRMMTRMMRRSSVTRSTTTVATTTMIKHPLWVPSAACGLGLLLLPLYLVSSWIKMGVLAFWALDHCRLLWVGTAHPWSVLCVWSECSNRDQMRTVCICDEPCCCGVSFSDCDLYWHQAWLLCPYRKLNILHSVDAVAFSCTVFIPLALEWSCWTCWTWSITKNLCSSVAPESRFCCWQFGTL